VLCVNSTAALRSAFLTDIGIAALQIRAVANAIAVGHMIRVLAAEALPESGIYAVYPSNRLITTKVRRFVDHLVPVLPQRLGDRAQDRSQAAGDRHRGRATGHAAAPSVGHGHRGPRTHRAGAAGPALNHV
jgi:hypothetical protein